MVFISIFFSSVVFADPTINTGLLSSVAIKGYDPVAYFEENQAVKGSKKFSFVWNEVKWHFSSQKNLDLFKENSTKYAPQYGGWSAYYMADGKKVGVNPKSFDIENGKLYLNYNRKIQSKWRKKKEKYIPLANKFWERI